MTADRPVRIATRPSALAMTQARGVASAIEAATHRPVELVPVRSSGDADTVSPVASLTELGAFVRAVQRTVLEGRADLAVHSLKDLPVVGPAGLVLAAIPPREDPRDVLVGRTLADLAPGMVVGTGSPRRRAQLARKVDGLRFVELRGNVDTRLAKQRAGEVDVAVLAAAGLRRLGLDAATEVLEPDVMVPAPGQGALAVEARADDPVLEVVAAIDHPPTRTAVSIERELLARTGAGCRSALGAYARLTGDVVTFHAFVEDERGARSGVVDAPPSEAVRRMREVVGL